jgi:5'-nucleotidase
MSRKLLFLLLMGLLLTAAPVSAQGETTVRLIHFSDYHSHAAPFYAEGEANTAGIARLIAYLKTFADDPNTLIFNGGDMLNKGSPAWSDKFGCVEWPWLNGLVDAMAYGNHESDYGTEAFAACQADITFPMLASNVVDEQGQPVFQDDGKTYKVFEVGGVKIGVFALAGSDFERLVIPENLPAPDAVFSDRVEAAGSVVDALRNEEQVNAVVLIGHALYEDDLALAQAVPGIDLIFGSHSHRYEDLTTIPGTGTVIISPFQYATYVSQLELTFNGGDLTDINGGLVQMSNDLPEDPAIAGQVGELQAELRADPDYADLYVELGAASVELSTTGQFTGEALLGDLVTDVMRTSAGAHMALSTSSSFREPIPPGPILEETLLTALPYKNTIYVYDMTGAQIQELLDYSVSRRESDFFSQVSGVRFGIEDEQATNVQILTDPAAVDYAPLDPAQTYQVATTNFQGLIAGGYKDIFAPASYVDTGLDVWDQMRRYISSNSPINAQLDGRMSAGEPAALPVAGGQPSTSPLALLLLGTGLAVSGLWVRQRLARRL